MVLLKYAFNYKNNARSNVSTFHYGSIKIGASVVKSLTPSRSTFHYGSIKIKKDYYSANIYKESTFHYGSIKI